MKVCVAGSRDLPRDWEQMVHQQLDKLQPDEVITGGARGPDTWAIEWARRTKTPHRIWTPDWKREGRSAGVKRTQRMLEAERPDHTLLYWDGESAGTRHTLKILTDLDLDYTASIVTPFLY